MGGATSAAGEAYLHFPVDSLQNPDLHVYSSPHSNLTVMLSIYSEEKNKTYKQNHYGDSLVPTTSQSTQGKIWFLPMSKLQLLSFLKQEEPKGRIKTRNWYSKCLKTV